MKETVLLGQLPAVLEGDVDRARRDQGTWAPMYAMNAWRAKLSRMRSP
jgi:hypothetical protein